MDTVELNPENLNPNPTHAALSLTLSHPAHTRSSLTSGPTARAAAALPRPGCAAASGPRHRPGRPSAVASLSILHRPLQPHPRAPQIRQHMSPAGDRNFVFFLPCSRLLRRWRAVGSSALVRRSSRRSAAATSSPCSRRLRRRRSRRTRGPSPPPVRTPSQRSISRRCQGPARRAHTGRGPSRWNFIPFSFSFH
jgi:hypothetical protein